MQNEKKEKLKRLVIKKGWYRTAGYQYKWLWDGNDVLGVGVNREYFEPGKKLIIVICGKEYILDCDEGLEFVNKYHSVIAYRNNKIGVVSKSLLKEANN